MGQVWDRAISTHCCHPSYKLKKLFKKVRYKFFCYIKFKNFENNFLKYEINLYLWI